MLGGFRIMGIKAGPLSSQVYIWARKDSQSETVRQKFLYWPTSLTQQNDPVETSVGVKEGLAVTEVRWHLYFCAEHRHLSREEKKKQRKGNNRATLTF
jgi:hypothetical protein